MRAPVSVTGRCAGASKRSSILMSGITTRNGWTSLDSSPHCSYLHVCSRMLADDRRTVQAAVPAHSTQAPLRRRRAVPTIVEAEELQRVQPEDLLAKLVGP